MRRDEDELIGLRWQRTLHRFGSREYIVAHHTQFNQEVFVVRQMQTNEGIRQQAESEYQINCTIGPHPHIVMMLQCKIAQNSVHTIHEYCLWGNLRSIRIQHQLSANNIQRYFDHLVQAVQHMHQCGYVHGDISLCHIMLTKSGVAKLSHFSQAFPLSTPQRGELNIKIAAPPEMYRNRPYHGAPVDVWCMGISLFEMLTGCQPMYFSKREYDSYREFQEKGIAWALQQHGIFNASPEVIDLLGKMLQDAPQNRITLQGIAAHSYLRNSWTVRASRRFSQTYADLLSFHYRRSSQ